MKFPNAYFGNGPGQDDDILRQRELEAYERNRVQMTVATSTFAGVALVGMFCSCLWFVCCRNSSSKTRKRARPWAAAEAGLQNNPYSYEGYCEAQGNYMQMTGNGGVPGDGGVAPYMSNPLYHPNSLGGDGGMPNPYDFTDNLALSQGQGGPQKAQLNQLFCGTAESNAKDVPPSYTALFFATSDATANGGKGTGGGDKKAMNIDPRVTSIQPIHLKVTSNAELEAEKKVNKEEDGGLDYFGNDFLNNREDPAAPVSLMSVESEPGGNLTKASSQDAERNGGKSEDVTTSADNEEKKNNDKPPPYNPGYFDYKRF